MNAVNNSRIKATGHSECCQQFQENRGYWSQSMLSTIPGELQLQVKGKAMTDSRKIKATVTVNAVNNSKTIEATGHNECCQQT